MRKLILLIIALMLSVGLAQAECVFYYTATEKLESQFSKLGTVTSHEFSNGAGTVTFANNVTAINRETLWQCDALLSITLPACVTAINSYAFEQCFNLQSVTLSAGVTTLGNSAFLQCYNLQSINLPASVTKIDDYAFGECAALQSIDLSHVTYLGKCAFSGCRELQSITLSENLTVTGLQVFSDCESLTDVTVAWTDADKILAIDASVFKDIAKGQGPSGATLHVPSRTKALYKAVGVWNTFGAIDDPAAVSPEYIAAAIAEIETAATTAKAAIDAASKYTAANATKTTYKNKIDEIVAGVKEAINNLASTEAMVDDYRDKAMLNINGRKEEAMNAIAKINELEDAKAAVIAEITTARKGIQNENLNKWADAAITDIQKSTTKEDVDRIKNQFLEVISIFQDGKAEGDAAGYQRAKNELPTDPEAAAGAAVVVTKGDKEVILYAPDKVKFIKVSKKE